ncbi:hypothetical protein Lal_00040021 [Lupinus albus]|nr:hypothetical protein Lal_00040021 [Lupinus albus]
MYLYVVGYILRIDAYMLHRVLNKAVPKTPYEKPNLGYLHIWGCPSEVKVYNLHEKKFDARIISGFFIGYPESQKDIYFIILTTL